MKYLVGAQANSPKADKHRQKNTQQLPASPEDSPNSARQSAKNSLRKKVKKKSPPAPKPGKVSITTRGDTITRVSERCPSNFDCFKMNHRFERLKKEVAVKDDAGRSLPITTNYELIRLRGRDKKNYRFYCFPDHMLDIRVEDRKCLKGASTDGQIETSVKRLTQQLKDAVEENRKNSRSSNAYYLP